MYKVVGTIVILIVVVGGGILLGMFASRFDFSEIFFGKRKREDAITVSDHFTKVSEDADYTVYKGTVQLSGTYHYDKEGFMQNEICFQADAASASKIPRENGDDRPPFFCFPGIEDEASGHYAGLGLTKEFIASMNCPSVGSTGTVLVRDYIVDHSHIQLYDIAYFVKILNKNLPNKCLDFPLK